MNKSETKDINLFVINIIVHTYTRGLPNRQLYILMLREIQMLLIKIGNNAKEKK